MTDPWSSPPAPRFDAGVEHGPAPRDVPDLESGRSPGTPGRRVTAAAGLVAVAVLGAAAGWLLGRDGTPTSPATSAARVTTSPVPSSVPASAAPSASTPDTPASVSPAVEMDPAAARSEVTKAGLRTTGAPVEAWSWTDANGRNVLLTTKTVDKREGQVIRAATLHVYQAGGLGTRPRMVLAPLRDPGQSPCELDYNLDFVPRSVQVTDRDGDGFGEASVGWWSSCRGDPGPVRLKLALLTKGTYYILRGYGLLASMQLPSGITAPPATFTPNVPKSRWPRGSYDATVALFHQLYR